jgi:peptidoglycan/LPS O-acetylase OafA/YrhL
LIPEKEHNSQWNLLAGLRFLLATCVVITHSEIVAPGYMLARWLGQTGYPAVFGFLMISGYSIAASIAARPKGYLYRRLKRIYPAYMFAIVLTWAVTIGGALQLPGGQMVPPPSFWTVIGNLLMVQGILVPVLAANGALWSLSIEWWCYMIGAVLIKFTNRVSTVIAVTSFVAMMIYCVKAGSIGGAGLPRGLNVAMMVWAWLNGFIYFREQSKTNFLMMLLLPMVMFEILAPLKFASVVLVVSALGILFSKAIWIESKQAKRLLNFLGNASYPLYLVHAPLLFALTSKTPIRNGNAIVVMIIAAVLIGYYLATLAWDAAISKVIRRRSIPTTA